MDPNIFYDPLKSHSYDEYLKANDMTHAEYNLKIIGVNKFKKLQILLLNDNYEADNGLNYKYKILSDSLRRNAEILKVHKAKEIHKEFLIPDCYNIKQMLRGRFGFRFYFNDDNYDDVIELVTKYSVRKSVADDYFKVKSAV